MLLAALQPLDWKNAVIVPAMMTIILGGWLALVTANIIYLRDIKARVSSALFDLITQYDSYRWASYRQFELGNLTMMKVLIFLGDDLKRRGFLRHEELVRTIVREIDLELKHLLASVVTHLEPTFSDEFRTEFRKDIEGTELPMVVRNMTRIRVSKALAARLVKDATRFNQLRGDLLGILELPILARYLDDHGFGRSSDRCEKCGHQHRVI